MKTPHLSLVLAVTAALPATTVRSRPAAFYDFTKGTQGWQGNRYTVELHSTPEGMVFRSTGEDPWLTSPVVNLPADARARFTARVRSRAGGAGRLYWGPKGFSEDRAIPLSIPADGAFHEASVVVRKISGPTLFRLDPATQEGPLTIAWIRIDALPSVHAPAFAPPERPRAGEHTPYTVSAGALTLTHYRRQWGGFVVSVANEEMAAGHSAGRLAVTVDDAPVFLELADAAFSVEQGQNAILEKAVLEGGQSGAWRLTRRIEPDATGDLRITVTVRADRGGELLHVPWLTLFPGLGTFGEHKTQAVIPGLEYLADEPSSSKADVVTSAHDRRVPDAHKLCFPFAAFCHKGRCIALRWNTSDPVALVQDSPDRIFHSGAHVIGLWAPGVGTHRLENELFAMTPLRLAPDKVLSVQVALFGCEGDSVVPAIRHYVKSRPEPDVPVYPGGLGAAVELLATGWTQSASYSGDGLWDHAIRQGSQRHPAADACMFCRWLANHTGKDETRERLEAAVAAGLKQARKADPALGGAIAHVRPPAAPFIFDTVESFLRQKERQARAALRGFEPNGALTYRKQGDKPDYSSTHFATHANGYAAARVRSVLEAALLTGDRALTDDAVDLLDKQTALYANTVPRGAQTWEVPLHTPDILASAYLTDCYVLGYQLTGREDLLAQARYWAWTGVPFVYLDRSTPGEIGDYATIPVFGATNWRAPVWLGLPVQWCGCVYAAALERLSRLDNDGKWAQLARGITASGLQQTWPLTDSKRQGLLPDVFDMRAQNRAGPAINPGTVEGGVPFLYGQGCLFESRVCRRPGWTVHAPCAIRDLTETRNGVSFRTDGWGAQPYTALIVGVHGGKPELETPPGTTVTYKGNEGWLLIRNVVGKAAFRVKRP